MLEARHEAIPEVKPETRPEARPRQNSGGARGRSKAELEVEPMAGLRKGLRRGGSSGGVGSSQAAVGPPGAASQVLPAVAATWRSGSGWSGHSPQPFLWFKPTLGRCSGNVNGGAGAVDRV